LNVFKVRPDLFLLDSDVALSKMNTVIPYRLDVPFVLLDYGFQPLYRRY
jgi:hypothetical protein